MTVLWIISKNLLHALFSYILSKLIPTSSESLSIKSSTTKLCSQLFVGDALIKNLLEKTSLIHNNFFEIKTHVMFSKESIH